MSGGVALRIPSLRRGYLDGRLSPAEVVARCRARIAEGAALNAWIHTLSDAELAPYLERLQAEDPAALPLYGVPFAIKDNIDLAGVPTTAGCPDFAYRPERSAVVVQRLIDAGALPLGKTNLDQFATGLVGTRSPYGACRNPRRPEYIAGGSSSGSAVAVAAGMASFALGTDTAGSGRVPAAFNGLVGLKPSRGLLSTRGIVYACRSLDCISLFAADAADARTLFDIAAAFDPEDAYARPLGQAAIAGGGFRFGAPEVGRLEFFGDLEAAALYRQAVERLQALGGEAVAVDPAPFREAARLLYEGPWVAERYAAIKSFIRCRPDSLHPVTRSILEPAASLTAVAAFESQYRLQALRRETAAVLDGVEFLVLPTAPTVYTVAEVEADPLRLNSRLGHYTNFMNLLDCCGVAVPAGILGNGVPWGVSFCAPAQHDRVLIARARQFLEGRDPALEPGNDGRVRLVVCGAHLSGLPLNHQLTERGGRLLQTTRTAPRYRLYALAGGSPPRPGLVRADGGAAIEVEVWSLPLEGFGDLVARVPSPLAIGSVELADGAVEKGFLCEPHGLAGARHITALGGWRRHLES